MKTIPLGMLYVNDTFFYKGQKHRANSVSRIKEINSVCCTNTETKKRIWLDIDTPVEIEEEK